MNLNNRGWSMKEMIVFSFILFVFLLVAIFNIIRLYHGAENSNLSSTKKESYSYSEVEENVLRAGIKYYQEFYEGEDEVRITTDKMKQHGFLKSHELIPNKESKECQGYVWIFEGEESSYITCQNYETIGYEE